MRLGVLTGSLSRSAGGLFYSVRRLSEELSTVPRTDIRVFGQRDRWAGSDCPQWRVPVTLLDSYGPSNFVYMPAMAKAVEAMNPECLHVHGIWMHLSTVVPQLARRAKVPYIVSPRGMLDPWALQHARLVKIVAASLYERRHLREATCIHALCESEAQAIRQFGVSTPVCVIPNGVDLDESQAELSPPAWANTISEGEKILLFIGRIHPKKGLEAFVRAWAALPPGHGWRLVIGGWDQGGHEADLKFLSEELGVARSISYVGPLYGPEKTASLRFADAFVLPSLSEGLPIAVLEAWAYRLPVLFTPFCNLPEGVAAGAAVCVDPTVPQLTEGLRHLISMNQRERQQMGLRGFTLVQQRFSWPTVARRMRRVYNWMLEGGAPPPDVLT